MYIEKQKPKILFSYGSNFENMLVKIYYILKMIICLGQFWDSESNICRNPTATNKTLNRYYSDS